MESWRRTKAKSLICKAATAVSYTHLLYNLVLKDIQELAAQAMKDADAFYQRLSSRMERRYLVDASQTEKERKQMCIRDSPCPQLSSH